jgi:hypothetical protein
MEEETQEKLNIYGNASVFVKDCTLTIGAFS